MYAIVGKDLIYLLNIRGLQHHIRFIGFDGKTVHVFDVDLVVVNDLKELLQAAHLVGDLDDGNVGEQRGEAAFG